VGLPMLTSGLAIWMIASYPITEERAHQCREQLEQRRGAASAAPAA